MSENGITLAELAKGTQNKIEKFKKETDPDLRESLDEVIYADVKEVVEKKNKEAKAEAVKKEHAEKKAAKAAATPPAGTKKDDVSGAPTATPTAATGTPPAITPPPAKGRGVMGTILGLGHQ